MERLPEQEQGGDEDEHALAAQCFRCPQLDESLAGAARHDHCGSVMSLERWNQAIKGLPLMREGFLLGGGHPRALEPREDRLEVGWLESVQIGASDAIEAASLLHERRQVVTVGEDDASRDAIGQAHERRQLAPRQGRAPAPELDLIGIQSIRARHEHAVHAHVARRVECEAGTDRHRDGVGGPHVGGPNDRLRGQVGLGEDLEGGAPILVGREFRQALFERGKGP